MTTLKSGMFVCLAGSLLALAACEAPQEPSPFDIDEAPPAVTVEATMEVFRQGVARLDIDTALSLIDGWRHRVSEIDVTHREEILDHLASLRTEVQRSPLDDGRIADLLDDLGNWTIATGAEIADSDVQRLGDMINRTAERIRTGDLGPLDEPPTPARPGAPGAVQPVD